MNEQDERDWLRAMLHDVNDAIDHIDGGLAALRDVRQRVEQLMDDES